MSHIQRDAYEPITKMGCGKPLFYFWLILEISRISMCFFEAVLIVLPFESPCSAGKCPTTAWTLFKAICRAFVGTGTWAWDVRVGTGTSFGAYSMLQYVTVSYSILQYLTVSYSILQYLTVSYSILQYLTVSYSILQYLTVSYSKVLKFTDSFFSEFW